MLPRTCVHCDQPALLVSELSPYEGLGAVLNVSGMCARHWSNFAQNMALSHGLTLLRAEERDPR
jgi:hypothetical protein